MIKKAILNEWLKTYETELVEQHLIYLFVTKWEINFRNSPILNSYFSAFIKNEDLYFKVCSHSIDTIKDLEKLLELIIPENDRKLNGAFFTPDYIIDFIINEIKPEEYHKNLDPSCGCGAFLVGLVDYYRAAFNKPIKNIIRDNLYGSDILEYNVFRTKIILSIYALQYGEIILEEDFNIYNQDSLKTAWLMDFDNIVGNPPYVKFQDLSLKTREDLLNDWTTIDSGTFNLYFAFFELGYKLLKSTGKLGYITPNNYFTSLSGEAIRKYFQEKKCISKIIDFSHKKVFDAQTYTAITFLNKEQNETILFDRIKDKYNPEEFLKKANGSPNKLADLNFKKWRLLKTDEQNNIKLLENSGRCIGELFEICVGIATLKDEVFFVDGTLKSNDYYIKSTDKGRFEIEIEATKPVYKISDFKTQGDIGKNMRRIIFPYTIIDGVAKAIPEKEFKEYFPKCYNYLLTEKDILLARDKGKVKFDPFYVWGRTQGLKRFGKRLLNPTFSQVPRFLYVSEEDSFFTNGYGLFFKAEEGKNLNSPNIPPIARLENIDVVQKILNSYPMEYYVSKTSVSIEGGYPCYQKNFIEKFTLPELSLNDIKLLRSFDLKEEIDDFLIEKYQLKVLAGNLLA